jgi:hypothetical protein
LFWKVLIFYGIIRSSTRKLQHYFAYVYSSRYTCHCASLSNVGWRANVVSLILNLSTRWRWVIGCRPLRICPWGLIPQYPLNRSYSPSWNTGMEKNLSPW